MLKHGVVIVVFALVMTLVLARRQQPAELLAGHWRGDAEVSSSWVKTRTLRVDVQIRTGGRVVGTIGDATLVDAALSLNRRWIGRLFGAKTDYRIAGSLSGPIVASENIARDGVWLPFNVVDGRIVGSVATTGSALGGPEAAILTASRLVLQLVPDATAESTSPTDRR
jgi:hypothetical protein